jgi:hypothetical protein
MTKSQQQVGQRIFERLLAEEREDDIVCSFGYDFFDGVRWASGCGSVLSFVAAWRLSGDIKKRLKAADAQFPNAYDVHKPMLIRGLRICPMMTIGVVSFLVTGVSKVFKWYSSSIRVNNFLLAEYELSETRLSLNDDPEARAIFDEYCKELAAPQGTLFRDTSKSWASQDQPPPAPSFSDGVAVGIYGSLFDSWLPTGPTSAYIGFTGGRKLY